MINLQFVLVSPCWAVQIRLAVVQVKRTLGSP
jgi:hypothetical protein